MVLSVGRPSLPHVAVSDAALTVQEGRRAEQASAKSKEQISAAYKGEAKLLRLVVERYQTSPTRDERRQKRLPTSYDTSVKSITYSNLVDLCWVWRKNHSGYCKSLDYDASKSPTPPPGGEEESTRSGAAALQRFEATPTTAEAEAAARARLRRKLLGDRHQQRQQQQRGGVGVAAADRQWEGWLAQNAKPRPGSVPHCRKQEGFSTGGHRFQWRKESPKGAEDLYQLFAEGAAAGTAPPGAQDQEAQMSGLGERLSASVREQMELREERKELSGGGGSFWRGGTATVPAAAAHELSEQLGRVNESAKRGVFPKSAQQHFAHICKWQDESGIVCGASFRFKKDLDAHQRANGNAHRVFVCSSKAGGAVCGNISFSEAAHNAHKATHRAAAKAERERQKQEEKKEAAPARELRGGGNRGRGRGGRGRGRGRGGK